MNEFHKALVLTVAPYVGLAIGALVAIALVRLWDLALDIFLPFPLPPVTIPAVAPEQTPPASNAPAPARTFGPIVRWLQRVLGIADQRHDFDALAMTLEMRDFLIDGMRRDLDSMALTVNGLARELSNYAGLTVSHQDRLHYYEQRVPGIFAAKKAYDAAIVKERQRRERLIAAHSEWSEATKQYVMQHGTAPGEETSGNGSGEPASNLIEVVQRMPTSTADLADPDRLKLVRENEGELLDDVDQADGA